VDVLAEREWTLIRFSERAGALALVSTIMCRSAPRLLDVLRFFHFALATLMFLDGKKSKTGEEMFTLPKDLARSLIGASGVSNSEARVPEPFIGCPGSRTIPANPNPPVAKRPVINR